MDRTVPKLAIIAVLLTCSTFAAGQAPPPPPRGLATMPPAASPSVLSSSRNTAEEDLRRENLELRVEAHVKDQTATWFATVIAISIALFAILITVVVIFFAIKTKEAAVAEATKGFDEFRSQAEGSVKAIRTEAELARQQMEEILLRAASNSEAIGEMHHEAQVWAENVAQRVAATHALSPTDQLTLDLRAARAQEKTADAYSTEDYFLLIAKYAERKQWDLVRELAGVMRLQTKNKALQCAGYFYEGTALRHLKKPRAAMKTFTDALARFAGSGDPEVKLQVAKCRNNLVVALMDEGEHERVLAMLPEAFKALEALPVELAEDLRRKLTINKGNALSRLGRNDEALAAYDEVIARVRDPAEGVDRDRLAHAHYNRACSLSLLDRVAEAIDALETSRSIAITPLTGDLNADPDFNPIRAEPAFQSFLVRHGLNHADPARAAEGAPNSVQPKSASEAGHGAQVNQAGSD